MEELLSKLLRQVGYAHCDRCCLNEDSVPIVKSLCCSPSGKTGSAISQRSSALLGNRSSAAKPAAPEPTSISTTDSAINSALSTFVRTFLRGTRIEVLLDDGSSIWPQVSLDYDITTLNFDLDGVRTSIGLGDVTHICFPNELPLLTDLHLVVEPYLTDACCIFVTRGSGSLACRFQNSRLCDYFTTCMQLLVSKAKSNANSPLDSQPDSSRTGDASWTPVDGGASASHSGAHPQGPAATAAAKATTTTTKTAATTTATTTATAAAPKAPLHDDELEVAVEKPEAGVRPPTPSAELKPTHMRLHEDEVY